MTGSPPAFSKFAVGGLAVMKASADTIDFPGGTAISARRNENMGMPPEVFFGAQIGFACQVDGAVKKRCLDEAITPAADRLELTCHKYLVADFSTTELASVCSCVLLAIVPVSFTRTVVTFPAPPRSSQRRKA